MPPFRCTNRDADVLHNYARSLMLLVSKFRWLTDAYVVEFFVKDHWHNLPSSWQDSLGDLELDEVALYLTGEKRSGHTSVWPLSLLAYCVATQSLALNRHPDRSLLNPGEDTQLDHCFKYHVKDKKRHEIKTLANIIHEATVSSDVNRVVDVGGGQGHLTRLLSVGYGLKVMSIEAAGCHVNGATKVDREVEVLRQRREKKGLLDLPKPSTTPQTPVHVVCTITPDVSVTEFISIVNHNLNQEKQTARKQEVQTSEESVDHCRDVINEPNSSNVLTNSRGDGTGDLIEMDGKIKHQDLPMSPLTSQGTSDGDSQQVGGCGGGIDSRGGEEFETLSLGECDPQLPQHQQFNETYHDNKLTQIAVQAGTLETDPELEGLNVSKLDQDPEDTNSESAARNETLPVTPSAGNEPAETRSGFEPFSLVGLHTCGDLGPTILRVFVRCPEAKVLALVGCCYMRMECVQLIEELDGIKPGRKVCNRGFPMSRWVEGLRGDGMTFEPLELACHFFDSYFQRLRDKDPSLIRQAYRAMLEILIQEQRPELVKKHAGIRQIKKATASLKKKPITGFKSYAQVALMKLGLTFDPDTVRQLEGKYTPRWKRLIIFHALRQCLAPIIESLVLVDRMLHLLENGIESQLTAVFDPGLSPRNFLLQASKS